MRFYGEEEQEKSELVPEFPAQLSS
jgi:hypothetical protein